MSMQDIRPITSPSRRVSPWIIFALWGISAFFLILFCQFARTFMPVPFPFVHVGQRLVVQPVGVLINTAYLALLLFSLMMMARTAAHLPNERLVLFLLGAALTSPYVTVLVIGKLFNNQPGIIPDWLGYSANSLFLPLGATLIGVAAGRLFNHTNTLLAAAGFAAFFDVIVVTLGTVAVLREKMPQVIAEVSVGTARPGHGPLLPPAITQTSIGPADVLFLGIFLAAIWRLRLAERLTFAVMYGLLLLALLSVEFIPGVSIPALLPMGIAVLIANAQYANLSREEKFALVYGVLFAVALAIGLVVGARAFANRLPPASQGADTTQSGLPPETAPGSP